ncbi:MAG: hypothetical protein COB66_07915 [Coxiella sp. (in: Bacteria)]|nr:MAG: hypothetical protein COB66_07915 [Coxiella sp. (in: g-proteobacteria)]
MKGFIYLLWVSVNPMFWVRNYRTGSHWDRSVLLNLQTPEFTELGDYTVKLNGKEIWIYNYPYAYATDNNAKGKQVVMPSRLTCFLFRIELDKYKLANGMD